MGHGNRPERACEILENKACVACCWLGLAPPTTGCSDMVLLLNPLSSWARTRFSERSTTDVWALRPNKNEDLNEKLIANFPIQQSQYNPRPCAINRVSPSIASVCGVATPTRCPISRTAATSASSSMFLFASTSCNMDVFIAPNLRVMA